MSNIQSLLKRYEDNRVIRGLIQLVPFGIGSAIDVVLCETLDKIREERAATFFDELSKGNVVVNDELLQSEDFLHAFFSTAKFALNTRRREKIEMFARLLKSSVSKSELSNIDEYEDYIKILDDLSYREILALKILDEYTGRPRNEDMSDIQWVNTFWDEFEQRLSDELNIPKNQVVDFMNRIARTGCYEMFRGGYVDYTGGKGKLTPTYKRLKEYIFEKSENG